MALLTIPQLRTHGIGAGPPEEMLQRLLNAAEAAIDARYGAPGERTEVRYGAGDLLPLARPAQSVATITETVGTTTMTLAADDFEISPSGRILRRLNTGTNKRKTWGERMVVTYTARDETAGRIRVAVGLVKLDLAYSGYQSESAPEYQRTRLAYDEQREALLSSLLHVPVTVA